jgi:hypothetical protein
MSIDPAVLSSIATAVTLLGTEVVKGTASEAGKATWAGIKLLFGWSFDPEPKEIPAKLADAVVVSPEHLEKLRQLLKATQDGTTATLVGKIDARDSKVIVAGSIDTLNMG